MPGFPGSPTLLARVNSSVPVAYCIRRSGIDFPPPFSRALRRATIPHHMGFPTHWVRCLRVTGSMLESQDALVNRRERQHYKISN
jgi:hypothetical protein